VDEPIERKLTPFDALLGLEVKHASGGESEVFLELVPSHCNRRGVAHGGVVCGLLDTALGAAVVSTLSESEWCATLELSVQFRDPARHGPLHARGHVARRGRRVAFSEGEVVDARDRVVAVAHGVWTIWPSHPDGRGTPST
jgi:uncharacterized protein (TIGR00369 family)